jgi:hypothetical protein
MSKLSAVTGGGSEHGPGFSQAECLTSLHLGAQFPYTPPFDHASLLNEPMFRPGGVELLHDCGAAGMDFAGGGHFDLPGPGDEASFQNWASLACATTLFDHQQHQQQQQLHQQQQPSYSAQVSSMSEFMQVAMHKNFNS